MKVSGLLYFFLGAALGNIAQVGASPLRVVVVTGSEEVTSNLRFGHAVSDANVAQLVRPITLTGLHGAGLEKQKGKTRHCGSRFRDKAISISNAFRQALGLPLIGTVHKTDGVFEEAVSLPNAPHHHHHHGKHHGGHRFKHLAGQSFMRRLHFALMALGPWEGRAVAFVLGCGIGVLLRMIWVVAIVSYRAMKGNQEDRNEYTRTVCEQYGDPEEILVAPPNYTLADEKIPILAENVAPLVFEETN